jgi:hypothetical protein
MPNPKPRTIAYADPLAPCPFALPAGPHEVEMTEVDLGVWTPCCNTCGCTGPIENFDNASQTAERGAELWNARANMLTARAAGALG